MRALECRQRPGLSFTQGIVHSGGNSGYQAVNLAVLAGAPRLLLLGYDMGSRDGRKHWHEDHPPGLNNPRETTFQQWRDAFTTAVPDLERAGVEVINCTPGSALMCFPIARLEDVI